VVVGGFEHDGGGRKSTPSLDVFDALKMELVEPHHLSLTASKGRIIGMAGGCENVGGDGKSLHCSFSCIHQHLLFTVVVSIVLRP
jgi:hypothetical protein